MCAETLVSHWVLEPYLGQVCIPLPCASELEPVDADRPEHLPHEDVVRQPADPLDHPAQHDVAEVGVGETCPCSNRDRTASEQ